MNQQNQLGRLSLILGACVIFAGCGHPWFHRCGPTCNTYRPPVTDYRPPVYSPPPAVPAVPPITSQRFEPLEQRRDSQWQPVYPNGAENRQKRDTSPWAQDRNPARLPTPEVNESRKEQDGNRSRAELKRPIITEENETPSLDGPVRPDVAEFPPDIPNYKFVGDQVFTGGKPFYPEGFDWLRAQGFRGVIHIHAAGDDAESSRTGIESKGLEYHTIELTQQTADRETISQFSTLIREPSKRPIFVYAQDESLAGLMWYLHYRFTDGLSEAAAREKAQPFGYTR